MLTHESVQFTRACSAVTTGGGLEGRGRVGGLEGGGLKGGGLEGGWCVWGGGGGGGLERGKGVEGVCLAILTILTSCSSGKKFVIQQIGKIYENITEKLYKLRYISSKVSEKLQPENPPPARQQFWEKKY